MCAGDELLRDLDREKKSGAGGRDVETGRFVAPILVWTKQAVAGNTMSGVAVATRIRSISSPMMPACSIAASAALAPMSLVYSSSAAIAALLDSGARGDPLVVGVDDLGEIVVR